jgi:hypothetical protein
MPPGEAMLSQDVTVRDSGATDLVGPKANEIRSGDLPSEVFEVITEEVLDQATQKAAHA